MPESGMVRATDKSIGQILLENGVIEEDQLEQALEYARDHNMRLGNVLAELGMISKDHIYWALAIQYGVTQVEIDPEMVDADLLAQFPAQLLMRYHLLPLIDNGEEVVVVTSDPLDQEGFAALSRACPSKKVMLQLANRTQIDQALRHLYPTWDETRETAEGNLSDRLDLLESRPAFWVSSEGLHWMMLKAAEVGGDLVIARQGAMVCTVYVDGAKGDEVLCEFDGRRFEDFCELIVHGSTPLQPSMPGQWMWAERLELRHRLYMASVSRTRSLGGESIRVRLMRTTASSFSMIDDYNLSDAEMDRLREAAEAASEGLGLLLVAPGANWSRALYHYTRLMGQGVRNTLFISACSRFVVPSVYQYAGIGDVSCMALGTLADQINAGHIVFDGPLTVNDWLHLRSASPMTRGISAVYRIQSMADGADRAPEAFFECLDKVPQPLVALVMKDLIEVVPGDVVADQMQEWRS